MSPDWTMPSVPIVAPPQRSKIECLCPPWWLLRARPRQYNRDPRSRLPLANYHPTRTAPELPLPAAKTPRSEELSEPKLNQ